MNTWEQLKTEVWKLFRKLTWGQLKCGDLKDLLVYKNIRYRELGAQYEYRELI
jgi:hypothetical protein